MILGLHHAALCTRDLDRTLRFYCDVMGGEVCTDGGWEPGFEALDAMTGLEDSAARFALLKLGDTWLEVFEYAAPVPAAAERRACDAGLAHLCFQVRDIDAEYERLRTAGVTFHAPPAHLGKGSAFVYGYDPDGNMLELVEVPASGGVVPSAYD